MNQIASCIKKKLDSNSCWDLSLRFYSFFIQLLLHFSQVLFKNSKASNSEWLFLYMIKKRNLILYCRTFLEQLCSKRSPYLVYGIKSVSTHSTEMRTKFWAHCFFSVRKCWPESCLCSSLEYRFIRHRGVIGLTLCTIPSQVYSLWVWICLELRATQLRG